MVPSSFRRAPRAKLLCALVASCFAAEGFANPTGPAVVSGSASFNAVGKSLTVTNSPNAIINWQGFSIGAGEATRFQQQSASSAVLNRIVGQDPSVILGTLWSNGRVFLVNPNGILFGQGSRVDVGGLVASTLNITDRDFLAGRLSFQAGAVANSIVNQGEIVTSSGGRIYLVAPDVQNHGLISSPGGEVLLAAGKTVSLVDADVPNLQVEVQAGGEALNVGKILAEGGRAGIYAGLINQRGIVRADSVSKDATGRIVFRASDTTLLDEGSVTSAAGAKGGEIQVLGNKVGLVGNAQVDASGETGGGTVLIGGDYQGQNPEIQNAYRTYFGPQSSVQADAITSGDGGKVIVWADDATRAYGTISARGGAQSGNGGFVEVSGKNWLDFNATVDTSAPKGATGVLLLDPAAVNIDNTADSGGSFNGLNPNVFSSGGSSSTLTWTTIKNHLTGAGGGSNTNVYVTTSGCSTPGSCGIDILAASPDLAASNTLRLVSHEAINVSGSITNTGSGALEMYAGWDGTSPVGSPTLSNGAGTITVSQPITFTGDVLLRAFFGITDSAGATITTPNLLASASSSSVNLSSATHMVGTLAGRFHDDFSFKNGQTLTIGSVGGVSGISTVASAGGAPTLQLTVTTGNLVVNSPISVTDGGGTTATTSVTLDALNGSISVNNTSVNATGGPDDSNNGQPASVVLNATNGGVVISNSTVSANGGAGVSSGDPGGSATVSLNATGGITANSSSSIAATGGASGLDTFAGANGGDASVNLVAGGTINLSASTLTGTGGIPPGLGTAGVGTVNVAVNSTSGNASPSGDIIVDNITADNVNLQQESLGVAKSILRASGTSLITTNQLLMESEDPAAVGGGSIGTSAEPMRVRLRDTTSSALRLEAHTHQSSPGIFVEVNPDGVANAGKLQIGGVSFFGGGVKGVQTLGGGDIAIAANTTGAVTNKLTVQSGTATCGTGGGTGGPICTTSGNITLRADNMDIANAVSAPGGTVTLTPYSTTRNVFVATSSFLSVEPVALVLHTSELAFVTANTLEIGRSTDSGSLQVNNGSTVAPFDMSAFNTVRLAHQYVTVSTNIQTSAASASTLEIRAAESIYFPGGADITSTVGPLNITLNSDRDASGSGQISLATGTVLTSNGGNVTLGGGADPATGFAVGDGTSGGAQHGVYLNGAQIIAGAGNVSIRGRGAPGTTIAEGVRLDASADVSTTTGSIAIAGTGGAGALGGLNRGIHVLDTGTTISSVDGAITLTGTGGSSTGTNGSTDGQNRGILINDGPVISTTGTGNIVLTGTGGTSVDLGSNTGVLITQASALGTQVTTVNGNITITGTGGSTTGATVGVNRGVGISPAEVRSTGSGSISITGTGGTSVNNAANGTNSGVLIQGDPDVAETFITTAGGNLSITGTAGSNSGTGGGHQGISIVNHSTVQSGGTGTLTLTGTAAAGNPAIVIDAVGGSINTAHARVESGGALNVTANGGLLTLAGATSAGGGEFAELVSNGAQTINAPGIVVTGGASGGVAGNGNYAEIGSGGAQTITVGSDGITVTGGGGGANYAMIGAQGNQTISVNGGNVSVVANAGSASIQSVGNQTLTLQGASSANALTVGNASSAEESFVRGSNQVVTVGTGGQLGSITVLGGTGAGKNSSISNTSGTQSVSTTGTISLTGGTATGTASTCNPAQSGSCAEIVSGGSALQTVSANRIQLVGGSGGVANSANIRNNAGAAQINVGSGGLSLQAGSGVSDNAASIGSGVNNNQTITVNVLGDTTLTGGSTTGSGALIGVGGTGDGQSVTVDFNGTGNLTLTGGSGPNGSAIGAGATATNTTTNLTIDAANVTLNPGTGSGSRLGHLAANPGGGDIVVTATGAIALNSAGPGLGTAIRTLGNVTLNAASITQGADSAIVAGGTTTLNGGSISLTSASNDFTGAVSLNSSGSSNVAITDANAIVLGTSTLGSGTLTVTAGGAITQSGPIVQAASAGQATFVAGSGNAITLTHSGNDFTGAVDLDSTGNVSVTDANSFIIQGGGGGGSAAASFTVNANGTVSQSAAFTGTAPAVVVINAGAGPIVLNDPANNFSGNTSVAANTTGAASFVNTNSGGVNLAASSVGGALSLTSGGPVTQAGAITVGGTSTVNAGANPISLTNSGNDFTGAVSLTGTNVSITDANALTLGAVSASSLTVSASTVTQNSSGVVVSGTSTLNAGTVTLNAATNDFGTLAVTSTGNVSVTDANAISIGTSSVGGTFDIVATSVSFLNGFSANNYSFSGGNYTLAAGTYNLAGTTTIGASASVTTSGAVNVPGGTIAVSGVLDSGTGTLTTGTVNILSGGTLKGTGTIIGNVNNSAGTVSPGASPGILTITGNYVQGASGTLDMQIGGLVAGTEYDQLLVSGTASLGGTLNTALIGSFVPVPGNSFTFIQAAGGVSGTFTTVNQPSGTFFNSFYGPTTFEFIATTGSAIPAPIEPSFNNSIVSLEPLSEPLIELIETIEVSVIEPITTTTPEGTLVPKPPACN